MEIQTSIDKEIIDSLGLDFQKVTRHQKKIYHVLQGKYAPVLPIIDVCSLENGEIVAWENLKNTIKNEDLLSFSPLKKLQEIALWLYKHVITCIPAAGVGARYWQGADSALLETYSQFPKALLPATAEADTFLDIKIFEQKFLFPTQSNVMIAPLNYKEKFENFIRARTQVEWLVLEQSYQLSTIRFQTNGSPYFSENAMYAPVPAGHGELINLFDDILDRYSHGRALHFRNIDNIIGVQPERKVELDFFASCFYLIRTAFDVIRAHVTDALAKSIFVHDISHEFLTCAVNFLNAISPNILPKLHCSSQEEQKNLLLQLNKPISVFGVVKKQMGDRGGGPVFVKTQNADKVKICLEMTHAAEQDYEKYFSDNGLLGYFNPVLVFLETQTELGIKANFKEFFDDNFWLLSRRPYLNTEVCYHETALYELIGNSQNTNLIFLEVPRTLFRPHKYFTDSVGQSRVEYGLNMSSL